MDRTDGSGYYRLLSLSGGGARGVFQARYLQLLEERTKRQVRDHFSGIAATSTGSIVGLAVADGQPASVIADLYREHARVIFSQRTLGLVRRGSRYSPDALRSQLHRRFGDRRLGDLPIDIFVAASVTNVYEGRLFTREDGDVRIVDAAMASCSAPTYFPATQLSSQDARAYVDGGLWANNPSLAALRRIQAAGLQIDRISVTSLGTGRVQRGATKEQLDELRPLSTGMLSFLIDSVGALQEWQVRVFLDETLPPGSYFEVNPYLPDWIALDDHVQANRVLPAIADSEFARTYPRLSELLDGPTPTGRTLTEMRARIPDTLVKAIAAGGLQTFIPARKYYKEYRGGAESITSYVQRATRDLTIVSLNLMTGDSLESILHTFKRMLEREDGAMRIRLSLLDPETTFLMQAVAPNLDLEPEELARQINRLVTKCQIFRDSLKPQEALRFEVHHHRSLPSASAILMDLGEMAGRIQLETKAYKTPAIEAFGFEVSHGSELFDSLRRGYLELIHDGYRVI